MDLNILSKIKIKLLEYTDYNNYIYKKYNIIPFKKINEINTTNTNYIYNNFKLYIDKNELENSELYNYITTLITSINFNKLKKKKLILSLLNFNDNILNKIILNTIIEKKYIFNNHIKLNFDETNIPHNILHFVIFYNLDIDILLYVLLLLYYLHDKDIIFINSDNDIFNYPWNNTNNKLLIKFNDNIIINNNEDIIYKNGNYSEINKLEYSDTLYKSISIYKLLCYKILEYDQYNLNNINYNYDYNYEELFINNIKLNDTKYLLNIEINSIKTNIILLKSIIILILLFNILHYNYISYF